LSVEKKIDMLIEYIKKLEERINELSKKVDEISEKVSEEELFRGPLLKGGRVINLEVTKREILKLLESSDEPLSAADISEKLGISRSHSSALLNELFREGKVNKIRFGKIIKFQVIKSQEGA